MIPQPPRCVDKLTTAIEVDNVLQRGRNTGLLFPKLLSPTREAEV